MRNKNDVVVTDKPMADVVWLPGMFTILFHAVPAEQAEVKSDGSAICGHGFVKEPDKFMQERIDKGLVRRCMYCEEIIEKHCKK